MKRAYEELSLNILQLTDSYVLLQASGESTGGGAFGYEVNDGHQDDFIE